MEKELTRAEYGKRVFHASFWGNIILAVLKSIIGFFAGSTAMIADALHTMSDVLSTIVVVGGLKYAHQPPDENHHYGHGKAEIIATKIVALILIVTAIGMGWTAVMAIKQPSLAVPGIQAVWAAVISMIIKEIMFQYTFRIGTLIKSNAIKADAWHHRSDAFSSVAAFIGIVGAIKGFPILDPVAGLVVSALIFRMGAKVYWDSLKELMDPAPGKEIVVKIINLAGNIEGVRSVNDVKARYHGSQILVDMKICVDPFVTVEKGHQIAANCRRTIRQEIEDIADVLIHVNPCFEGKNYEDESNQEESINNCHNCERRL